MPGNAYWKGRLNTIDLLLPTCFNPAAFDIANIIYFFTKQATFNLEVNRTNPSPSISLPWMSYLMSLRFAEWVKAEEIFADF